MTTRVITTFETDTMAELQEVLGLILAAANYREDEAVHPRQIACSVVVSLSQETLSDGSAVHNLAIEPAR